MKSTTTIVAVAVALGLQTTLGHVLGGRLRLDLVLVTVAWIGLTLGPGFGLLAGTIGGLAQDALGTGILGTGGLAKTIVGYLAGIVGTQFIVAQMLPRFLVFAAVTFLQALIIAGLDFVLGAGGGATLAWAAVGRQALGNAVLGVLLFQIVEFLPGAVERRRMDRGRVHVGRLRE